MRLNSRRPLRVEGLETRMLLAADVAAVAEAFVDPSGHEISPPTIIIGDVNGDGSFDPSDLVEVFQAGRYQTDQPADWSEGDWNGDHVFDSGDLVFAFQSGNYESEGAAAKSDTRTDRQTPSGFPLAPRTVISRQRSQQPAHAVP